MFSDGFDKTANIARTVLKGAKRTGRKVGRHFDRNDMRYIAGTTAAGSAVSAYAHMTNPSRKKKGRN